VDKYRIYADRLNLAGEKCRAIGLSPFLYHNQIYDFAPRDGTTGYQVLTDQLDKKLCALEMDVYWVSLAGYDPAEYLHKYSGRVKIIHMKDKPAGLQPMFDHVPAPGNYLDVGSGSLDWPAILRAAAAAGVEHYIVEPDAKSATYMVQAGRQSFAYLSNLQF
jgi:sugar phosphate isomerase/epimerase